MRTADKSTHELVGMVQTLLATIDRRANFHLSNSAYRQFKTEAAVDLDKLQEWAVRIDDCVEEPLEEDEADERS